VHVGQCFELVVIYVKCCQRPRGHRVRIEQTGSLKQILTGPSSLADGASNIVGALARSMATTGYSDLKEFQRVEVVIAPYVKS
jgi:IMP dehydrogenase